jgi:uncharacterized surface protein with fasciclin (FAS1) repeats
MKSQKLNTKILVKPAWAINLDSKKIFMKKSILKVMAVVLLSCVMFIRCGSASSVLGAGSPLISGLTGAGNLGTMAGLLQTPGLGKLMGGALKGPFTLLAPTDNALAGLGKDALTNLTKPENLNQLAGILSKHIVPGKLDAAGLAKGALNSAAGSKLDLGGLNLGNAISGGKNANIFPIDKILK